MLSEPMTPLKSGFGSPGRSFAEEINKKSDACVDSEVFSSLLLSLPSNTK
jgi:hypothetical protein